MFENEPMTCTKLLTPNIMLIEKTGYRVLACTLSNYVALIAPDVRINGLPFTPNIESYDTTAESNLAWRRLIGTCCTLSVESDYFRNKDLSTNKLEGDILGVKREKAKRIVKALTDTFDLIERDNNK